MDNTIKESVEALKKTTHDLAEVIKKDSENRTKIEAVVEDLVKKQKDFEEKSQERKGVFSGDWSDSKAEYLTMDVKNLNSIIQSDIKGDDKISYLRRKNDDIMIVSQVLGVDPRQTKLYQDFVNKDSFMTKAALYSTGAGVGDEWVPTGYSADLYEKIRLALKVAALHPSVNMPTNPYIPPLLTADSTGYLVSERTDADDTLTANYRIPASTPTTSNFTLTAKKLAGRIVFSEEMSEDSIIPVMPMVRRNIVIAIATAIEQAVINGDTTGTHQDSDVTVATDARKSWIGYRKAAQSAAKVSLSTFTGDTLMSVRKAMGKYGVNPSDLALVVGISGYMQLLNLRDAQNNQLVTTLEKYGSGATILTGELARIYGIPIIVSEFVRENLNATGVYDGSTTTKTVLMIVYKPGFLIGNRRMLTLKSAEDITTDQTVLVATQRLAFAQPYSAATDYTVGLGYNITS